MERGSDAPVIVRAEDILAKMRAGVKETHEIRMRDQTFPVRLLAMDEIAAIRRDAAGHAARYGGDETEKNVHIQKCTLKLASTLSKGGAPLISDALIGKLTLDEMQYLYSEYIRVMDNVNPSIESMQPDEFRVLVDALKKNSMESKDCSLRQLRAICSAFQELIQRQVTPDSPPAS